MTNTTNMTNITATTLLNITQHILLNMSTSCRDELLKLLSGSVNLTLEHSSRLGCGGLMGAGGGKGVDDCSGGVPTAYHLMQKLPAGVLTLYFFLLLSTIITMVIYCEEVIFISTHFVNSTRKNKTIWLLGVFPMYSMTALLGVAVPRSGPLVDMVANAFFGTCMYSFGQLMVDYMGGTQAMWNTIESPDPQRLMRLNTPPVCCCCVCLPSVVFNRKTYKWLSIMVMQVCLVRPFIMFLAAVMWADGIYVPGDTSMNNGFIYVALTNMVSTMTAVYALMLTRGVLRPELQERFLITGKIACLQLSLLTGVIPNLIISILVSNGVIQCTTILTSKGRGEILYHILLVFLMVPLQLMARYFYRRPQDVKGYAREEALALKDHSSVVHSHTVV